MNVFDIEAAYHDRLRQAPGFPADAALFRTFDVIDWTGERAPKFGLQTFFDTLLPGDQSGASMLVRAKYDVDIYLNHVASSPVEAAAAQALATAALAAIPGWEYRAGRAAAFAAPNRSAADRQFCRISIAFTVPIPQVGF